MINFYAHTRKKKDYLLSSIEKELNDNNIGLSLFDDKLQWNIYAAYGEGFMETDSNTGKGYSYLDMFDLDFVVLECITTPNLFRANKTYWLILRLGETSGVNSPEIQEYQGHKIWDSDSASKTEIVKIALALCKDANDYYYNREKEYRRERYEEQEG